MKIKVQVILYNYKLKILAPAWCTSRTLTFQRYCPSFLTNADGIFKSAICILAYNGLNNYRTASFNSLHAGQFFQIFVSFKIFKKFIVSTLFFADTVDSRYLELGYLEVCEARSVYLNQKSILIAFSNYNLALRTFLQVQVI